MTAKAAVTFTIIESILIGLCYRAGLPHDVGHSSIRGDEEVSAKVEPLMGSGGFTGHAPAGKNRWAGGSATWSRL
jgi:hypothetical protein